MPTNPDMQALLNDPVALWGALALLVALPLGLWDVIRTELAIRASVRNTSRFELFAVRDRLVDLVVTGKVREDDSVWRAAYEATNNSLSLNSKRDLWGEVARQLRFNYRAVTDDSLRRGVLKFSRKVDKACKRVPELRPILDDMVKADLYMLANRTGRLRLRLGLWVAMRFVWLAFFFSVGLTLVGTATKFATSRQIPLKLFRTRAMA